MSKWQEYGMDRRVRDVLEKVPINNPEGHHFGRPFMSSYQIAIALDRADPQLKVLLGKGLGGAGTGAHDSLAQYVGNELSRQKRAVQADTGEPESRRRGCLRLQRGHDVADVSGR